MSVPRRVGAAPRPSRTRPLHALAGLAAAVLAVALVLHGGAAGPPEAEAAADRAPRVVLAFLPIDEDPPDDPGLAPESILDRLEERTALALGLTGVSQGRYEQIQAFLDMSAGSRVSTATYRPENPPELELYQQGVGGLYQRWLETLDRAEDAPANIRPGLLGENVPGGTAYVGVTGRHHLSGIVAADRAGRIDLVSVGAARDVADRARGAMDAKRFVVVGLPTGEPGGVALNELISSHDPRDLLIVMQTPPDFRAPQLLPTGVIGLGTPGKLSSSTTRRDGLIAGIDILPTVLRHLGVEPPSSVAGQVIEVDGERDADALRELNDRLRVVGARRFPALETMVAVWLSVLLVAGFLGDRRGIRGGLRVGALAFLWVLPVLLVTAALAPTRDDELLLIAAMTFTLGFLTDRLVPWPRGPLIPGIVTAAVYIIDLAQGSDLIIQSLLGPNPRFGSRYYGIGNELESSLPVVLFLGLAGLLWQRGRSRRSAAIFAGAGLVLGAAMGAGRLGADVGGVITVGAGAAVATVLMLPGGFTKLRTVIVLAVPALALGALAVVDLATGGDGHFTRTVLRAEDGSDLVDTVERRFELAYNVLKRGLMPYATAISALAIAYAWKYRRRIFAPLAGDPAWRAALIGGAAAGIAGAVSNDSGPMLLLIATVVLAIGVAYIRGDPRLADADLRAAGATIAELGTPPSGASQPDPVGADR